ncbi:hypothetical protein Efla_003510 [Eimeria flavescens]
MEAGKEATEAERAAAEQQGLEAVRALSAALQRPTRRYTEQFVASNPPKPQLSPAGFHKTPSQVGDLMPLMRAVNTHAEAETAAKEAAAKAGHALAPEEEEKLRRQKADAVAALREQAEVNLRVARAHAAVLHEAIWALKQGDKLKQELQTEHSRWVDEQERAEDAISQCKLLTPIPRRRHRSSLSIQLEVPQRPVRRSIPTSPVADQLSPPPALEPAAPMLTGGEASVPAASEGPADSPTHPAPELLSQQQQAAAAAAAEEEALPQTSPSPLAGQEEESPLSPPSPLSSEANPFTGRVAALTRFYRGGGPPEADVDMSSNDQQDESLGGDASSSQRPGDLRLIRRGARSSKPPILFYFAPAAATAAAAAAATELEDGNSRCLN